MAFACVDCNKTFAKKYLLNRHLVTHTQIRNHLCPVCGKAFLQSSALNRHAASHESRLAYGCDECGKRFNRSSTRDVHRLTHSQKINICNYCGKSFHQRSTLKTHELIHKGIKPYPCSYCDKTFRQHSNLQAHIFRWHSPIQNSPLKISRFPESGKSTLCQTPSAVQTDSNEGCWELKYSTERTGEELSKSANRCAVTPDKRAAPQHDTGVTGKVWKSANRCAVTLDKRAAPQHDSGVTGKVWKSANRCAVTPDKCTAQQHDTDEIDKDGGRLSGHECRTGSAAVLPSPTSLNNACPDNSAVARARSLHLGQSKRAEGSGNELFTFSNTDDEMDDEEATAASESEERRLLQRRKPLQQQQPYVSLYPNNLADSDSMLKANSVADYRRKTGETAAGVLEKKRSGCRGSECKTEKLLDYISKEAGKVLESARDELQETTAVTFQRAACDLQQNKLVDLQQMITGDISNQTTKSTETVTSVNAGTKVASTIGKVRASLTTAASEELIRNDFTFGQDILANVLISSRQMNALMFTLSADATKIPAASNARRPIASVARNKSRQNPQLPKPPERLIYVKMFTPKTHMREFHMKEFIWSGGSKSR